MSDEIIEVNEAEQQQLAADHRKFDRNLRVVAGVITVLGVAATTVMKIMEAEKQVRLEVKVLKGRPRRKTGAKKASRKRPPKMKVSRARVAKKDPLERQVESLLKQIKKLEKEVSNG